jgi:hypothetical protein
MVNFNHSKEFDATREFRQSGHQPPSIVIQIKMIIKTDGFKKLFSDITSIIWI